MTVVQQKVLCVDHSHSNVHLIESIFDGLNMEIKTVVTATHALKLLEIESFSTLIVNLRPADMDGMEFITTLRSTANVGEATRVIGITTNTLTAEHEEFLKAGVDQILTRPISSQRLKAVLTGHSAGADDNPESTFKMTFNFGQENQEEELDASTVKQLVADIGAENTREAMTLFRNELDNNHGWIKKSIGTDSDDIAMGAHSIKGCAKALGAARIAETAEDLETACRLGATDEDLKKLLAELGRAVSRFKQSLETTDLQKFAATA